MDGQHGGRCLAPLQECPEFESTRIFLCGVHALLTGYSKFVIGVNVNVDGCPSLSLH